MTVIISNGDEIHIVELSGFEIGNIIEELKHAQFNVYEFLEYGKIVDKLEKALSKNSPKKEQSYMGSSLYVHPKEIKKGCGKQYGNFICDGETYNCGNCEKSTLPEKAVKGLISAIKDVEKGDYITLVNDQDSTRNGMQEGEPHAEPVQTPCKDNADSICKNCKKPKSQHIPCTTNDKVFWCYPNRNDKGYDEKKHLKKWAYQFEPKDLENTKNEHNAETISKDSNSERHSDMKELMDSDYNNIKLTENGGSIRRRKCRETNESVGENK